MIFRSSRSPKQPPMLNPKKKHPATHKDAGAPLLLVTTIMSQKEPKIP
jgi:hypothetical protein